MNPDRYMQTVARLRARYRDDEGMLYTIQRGQPTKYARLEALAARRYLGVDIPPPLVRQRDVVTPGLSGFNMT